MFLKCWGMKEKLSKRAEETLVLIRGYKKSNGYSPSVRDLADGMGFVSTNAVHKWLVELEAKGAIRRERKIPRSIVLV